MSHEWCVWLAALGGVLVGTLLGLLLRDGYWRSKAASGIRALSGGRFYFVIEDGDIRTLQHVQRCISSVRQS